jgi:hypothetical protein
MKNREKKVFKALFVFFNAFFMGFDVGLCIIFTHSIVAKLPSNIAIGFNHYFLLRFV